MWCWSCRVRHLAGRCFAHTYSRRLVCLLQTPGNTGKGNLSQTWEIRSQKKVVICALFLFFICRYIQACWTINWKCSVDSKVTNYFSRLFCYALVTIWLSVRLFQFDLKLYSSNSKEKNCCRCRSIFLLRISCVVYQLWWQNTCLWLV